MSKFDSALSIMSEIIFPTFYDADSCFRQAKRCWVLMEETGVHTENHQKYFWLADYWCRQSSSIHSDRIKQNHEFHRIFGDFMEASFKELSRDKKMAIIKKILEK